MAGTDTFDMWEGEDAYPYYPIEDAEGNGIDLSAVEEVTFVAAGDDGVPIMAFHLSDPDTQISIGIDPADTSPDPVYNTAFVHFMQTDTDGYVGTFRHEVAVIIRGVRTVVFPTVVGEIKTFTVFGSLTWNEETHVPRMPESGSRLIRATGPKETESTVIDVRKPTRFQNPPKIEKNK